MTNLRVITLVVCATALGACTNLAAREVFTLYDKKDGAWSRSVGGNTIRGTATWGSIMSEGGDSAELFPVTPYTTELMTYAYGNTSGGPEIRDIAPAISPLFRANDLKVEYCNSRGIFTFGDLPDGEYFVVATVAWKELGANRNKHVMKRVAVHGGQTVELAIAE
jgi:hypothetical protein